MGEPLERLLTGLLVASKLWARRDPVDEDRVRQARDAALLQNHDRYVRLVPAYRRLVEDLGLSDVDDMATIVGELLVGVALFKSYDDTLLDRLDFTALTRWLEDISTLSIEASMEGVSSLDEWTARLREHHVYVMTSSGTSGRPSLIPRDRSTLAALSTNGRWYAALPWTEPERNGQYPGDCLLLARPGRGIGIGAVSMGLAATADRSCCISMDGRPGPERDAELETVRRFVDEAPGGRLLVFGAPPTVATLCAALVEDRSPLSLAPGSLLVTGGGWKGADGHAYREELPALAEAALGLDPDRMVDGYGLSECNAYLIRCREGRYHVPPMLDAIVVDDLLVPLTGDDAEGQIALLDPFAFSYPGFLLTGDQGRLVRTPCRCGLAGPGFVGEIERLSGQEPKGCAGAVPAMVA